jgi:hypothetical protein
MISIDGQCDTSIHFNLFAALSPVRLFQMRYSSPQGVLVASNWRFEGVRRNVRTNHRTRKLCLSRKEHELSWSVLAAGESWSRPSSRRRIAIWSNDSVPGGVSQETRRILSATTFSNWKGRIKPVYDRDSNGEFLMPFRFLRLLSRPRPNSNDSSVQVVRSSISVSRWTVGRRHFSPRPTHQLPRFTYFVAVS